MASACRRVSRGGRGEACLPLNADPEVRGVPGSARDLDLNRGRSRAGFTLMEMLVVIGIISIFVGVIGFGFLRGSGSATVGLQSAQSTLVALLTQARSQAVITGRDAAVLVNNNSANATRYRRYISVVVRDASNTWQPLDIGVYLPEGVYVVPRAVLGSSEVEGGDWSALESSALRLDEAALAIEAAAGNTEAWFGISFTARGTTGGAGNVVLATGRAQPVGTTPPILYTNPNAVRGVAVTAYGLTRMLNDARDFGP